MPSEQEKLPSSNRLFCGRITLPPSAFVASVKRKISRTCSWNSAPSRNLGQGKGLTQIKIPADPGADPKHVYSGAILRSPPNCWLISRSAIGNILGKHTEHHLPFPLINWTRFLRRRASQRIHSEWHLQQHGARVKRCFISTAPSANGWNGRHTNISDHINRGVHQQA